MNLMINGEDGKYTINLYIEFELMQTFERK